MRAISTNLKNIELVTLDVHAVKSAGRLPILKEAIALALDQLVAVHVIIFETSDDDSDIWEEYVAHPHDIQASLQRVTVAAESDEGDTDTEGGRSYLD
jgi:hypothetical protein